MARHEIEKEFNLEYKGYTFKIERNKGKDVFLRGIRNNNIKTHYYFIMNNIPWFPTIKSAKNHAIELIESDLVKQI